jgi:hypothetical protein
MKKQDVDFSKLTYNDIQIILRFAHAVYLEGDKDRNITHTYLNQVSIIRGFISFLSVKGYEIVPKKEET